MLCLVCHRPPVEWKKKKKKQKVTFPLVKTTTHRVPTQNREYQFVLNVNIRGNTIEAESILCCTSYFTA